MIFYLQICLGNISKLHSLVWDFRFCDAIKCTSKASDRQKFLSRTDGRRLLCWGCSQLNRALAPPRRAVKVTTVPAGERRLWVTRPDLASPSQPPNLGTTTERDRRKGSEKEREGGREEYRRRGAEQEKWEKQEERERAGCGRRGQPYITPYVTMHLSPNTPMCGSQHASLHFKEPPAPALHWAIRTHTHTRTHSRL